MDLGNDSRRLPVYLLIDTSGSMAGAPITAVNEGLKIFEEIVRNDQQCKETVHISVIRFDSDASQMQPLTEAEKFTAPMLAASGGTALSKGMSTLRDAIAKELKPKSGDYAGDYKPLVFLLTDGQPNPADPWKQEYDQLNSQKGRRPGLFVAIGAGPGADEAMLRQLAPENTHMLASLDSAKLRDLFKWMANSTIAVTGNTVANQNAGGGQALAAAPPTLFSP